MPESTSAAPYDDRLAKSYDELPYPTRSFPQSHPDRLAAIGTLRGMDPAPIDRARVLELGCGTGGNIIPVAELFPETQFVGIDLSQRQISIAQSDVERLGLRNIQFQTRDLLTLTDDFGRFDYIIAHGVYSWVPKAVQEKILWVCRHLSSERGICYISYNTLPGWSMRGVIRELIKAAGPVSTSPTERVKRVREVANLMLKDWTPNPNEPFHLVLRRELELLNNKPDSYLLHEWMEEYNEPMYYKDFVTQARQAGLTHIGEADAAAANSSPLKPELEAGFRRFAKDEEDLEQLRDFARMTTFRRSLLCRDSVKLNAAFDPQRVTQMHPASTLRPKDANADLKSPGRVEFQGAGPLRATLSDAPSKLALATLAQRFPHTMPFADLVQTVAAALEAPTETISNILASTLLQGFLGGGVELHAVASRFVTAVSERPRALGYGRLLAERSGEIITARHEQANLNDTQRQLLRLLDGTRDVPAILDAFVQMAMGGGMVLQENGQQIRDPERVRAVMSQPVRTSLDLFARMTLLLQ